MKKFLLMGCSILIAASVGCTGNQASEEKAAMKTEAKKGVEKVAEKPKCTVEASHIVDADNARKRAASVGGEWRDTAKFIKQAHAAVKAGKCHKAEALAKKALMEGQLGYEQAMSQKELKMPGYFKF
ncbi:MAG: SoxXA-binding protein [Gammaproteobacteria bacterium]|nr:SoxXA-binding protein [Gammaproteobacteria bacterium]